MYAERSEIFRLRASFVRALNRFKNVMIHIFYALVHVQRSYRYALVRVFKYHEQLMSKSLSHPRDVFKIKDNLLEFFKTVAQPFCLRTR